MIKLTNLHVIIIVMGTAQTEQKLLFSRSGGVAGISCFRTMFKLPLDDCRIECMARSSCVSVNYFRSSQRCELNKMAGGVWNVDEKAGSVYGVKTDWTDNIFDQCSCNSGEKCVATIEGHECVVEICERLPSQTSSHINTVGAKADINAQCLEDTQGLDLFGAGGTPSTTRATMTCSPDGTWKLKTPYRGECQVVAFVMAPGMGQDPFYEWVNGASSSSNVRWNQYYRNNIIDKWSMLPISHIRFSIFKNIQEVKHIVFNGAGSTSLDWFAQSRVIESSWNDLSSADYNFFAISGDQALSRRFFMSNAYSGCNTDVGWFVAAMVGHCDQWERADKYPTFVYSTSVTAGILQTESEKADYVYIALHLDTY